MGMAPANAGHLPRGGAQLYTQQSHECHSDIWLWNDFSNACYFQLVSSLFQCETAVAQGLGELGSDFKVIQEEFFKPKL